MSDNHAFHAANQHPTASADPAFYAGGRPLDLNTCAEIEALNDAVRSAIELSSNGFWEVGRHAGGQPAEKTLRPKLLVTRENRPDGGAPGIYKALIVDADAAPRDLEGYVCLARDEDAIIQLTITLGRGDRDAERIVSLFCAEDEPHDDGDPFYVDDACLIHAQAIPPGFEYARCIVLMTRRNYGCIAAGATIEVMYRPGTRALSVECTDLSGDQELNLLLADSDAAHVKADRHALRRESLAFVNRPGAPIASDEDAIMMALHVLACVDRKSRVGQV